MGVVLPGLLTGAIVLMLRADAKTLTCTDVNAEGKGEEPGRLGLSLLCLPRTSTLTDVWFGTEPQYPGINRENPYSVSPD